MVNPMRALCSLFLRTIDDDKSLCFGNGLSMICRGDFTAKWLGFDPVRPDGNGRPPLGQGA